MGGAGGTPLKLCCDLAASADQQTRAAAVEAICACAELPECAWCLVGLGAFRPLLAAAAEPGPPFVAETARRALQLLQYDDTWRDVPNADPLVPVVRPEDAGQSRG